MKGLPGSSSRALSASTSFFIKNPATAGRNRAIPEIEAWALCAAPKASSTYKSASDARFLANSLSLFFSPGLNRKFSSIIISPGCILLSTYSFIWGEKVSLNFLTGLPINFFSSLAAGVSLYFSSTASFGLPR